MIPVDGAYPIVTLDGEPTPIRLQDLLVPQGLEDELMPLVFL